MVIVIIFISILIGLTLLLVVHSTHKNRALNIVLSVTNDEILETSIKHSTGFTEEEILRNMSFIIEIVLLEILDSRNGFDVFVLRHSEEELGLLRTKIYLTLSRKLGGK